MSDKTVEHEQIRHPSRFNEANIKRRFGKVLERPMETAEEIELIVAPENIVAVSELAPGIEDHNVRLEVRKTFSDNVEDQIVFVASLTDTIFLNAHTNAANRERVKRELIDEVVSAKYGGADISEQKIIGRIFERARDLNGWEILWDFYDGSTDGGAGNADITFVKRVDDVQNAVVRLNFFGAPNIDITVPLVEGFDATQREVGDVLQILSQALELDFTPSNEYEFLYPENFNVKNHAATSETFVEYFYKALGNTVRGEAELPLRAVINENESGQVLMIVEDAALGAVRDRAVAGFMNNVNSATMSSNAIRVASHDDIVAAFNSSVNDGNVSRQLAEQFPISKREGWLHMFLNFRPDGGVELMEDSLSNAQTERTEELIKRVQEEYGISYGGLISKELAEKMAKSPMLAPQIKIDTAIIRKKYGSHAANAYRRAATNYLINGDVHSKEVYDTYRMIIHA